MGALGFMAVRDMVAEVQGLVQQTSLTHRNKVIAALNRAYDEIVADYDWPQLERTADFSLAAGSLYFPLPWEATETVSIALNSPTAVILTEESMKKLLLRAGPEVITRSVPLYYARAGMTAQKLIISTSQTLTAKSSDAGNDAPVVRSARIRYRENGAEEGRFVYADVQGDFTTGVDLPSDPAAGWSIETVALPAGWVGDFRIEDASANVYVDVDNTERLDTTANAHYQTWSRPYVRIWPVPDATYTGFVSWQMRPPALLADDDKPLIPVSSAIVDRAVARMLRMDRRPDEAPGFERTAEAALARVRGAEPQIREGMRPKGGDILGASGIRRPW